MAWPILADTGLLRHRDLPDKRDSKHGRLLLALKMGGATWQGMKVASRSYEWTLSDSKQGNGGFSPTTTRT